VESRIQYGYYTEDARSLHGVMELLAPADAPDATKSYYAGLANYRLTQLAAAGDKSRAKGTAEACVSSLDLALQGRKDFADALALQSVCLDRLAALEAWRTPFAASKSGSQIEKARHLAPRNPRVLLLDAVELYERPKSTAADKEHALSVFRSAAAAFEAERQEAEHVPGWGAAEAYVYLAKCYLDRGATLEARDALERALLIAPEFAEARRLMAQFTSG
jgi:tetratricopeptide (TPR) repeat protein